MKKTSTGKAVKKVEDLEAKDAAKVSGGMVSGGLSLNFAKIEYAYK